MDSIITQLAVSSSGLIGSAGDFSNKVKGLVRGTGTLDQATRFEMQKDLEDTAKYVAECLVALAVPEEDSKKK